MFAVSVVWILAIVASFRLVGPNCDAVAGVGYVLEDGHWGFLVELDEGAGGSLAGPLNLYGLRVKKFEELVVVCGFNLSHDSVLRGRILLVEPSVKFLQLRHFVASFSWVVVSARALGLDAVGFCPVPFYKCTISNLEAKVKKNVSLFFVMISNGYGLIGTIIVSRHKSVTI
jgi:hypothetical protein